jgi:hypothetical protein
MSEPDGRADTSSQGTSTASRQIRPRPRPQNRTVQAISGDTHRDANEHGTAGLGMPLPTELGR